MTNNQATLHKLDQKRLHGMSRSLRTSLETQGQWTADELLAHLVDAEWDDRHERRLKRTAEGGPLSLPEPPSKRWTSRGTATSTRTSCCGWPTVAGCSSTRTSSSPANAAPGIAYWPPRWAI